MPKDQLDKAISAAANKDYEGFKDAISGGIEDKFRDAIGDVVERSRAEMFGGEYESAAEEDFDADEIDDENGDD